MIIIHIDTQDDTFDFHHIYDGFRGIYLYNPTRASIDLALSEHYMDTVLLIGHGSRDGLFGVEEGSMAIDKDNVDLLRDRTVIGVWCYAAEFADIYNLTGFFTSMYISNMQEALMFNLYRGEDEDITDETIRNENIRFSIALHDLIRDNVPVSEWVGQLQDQCNKMVPFVVFNHEALYSNTDSDVVITDFQ